MFFISIYVGQMSSRGNIDRGKGKLPVTRGRGKVMRPGAFQIHTDRIRRQPRVVGSSSAQPPQHVSSARLSQPGSSAQPLQHVSSAQPTQPGSSAQPTTPAP